MANHRVSRSGDEPVEDGTPGTTETSERSVVPSGGPVRCSLVVLNYDERDLLLSCIRSMLAAVGPTDEIIVVDNGSHDGSADAISRTFPSVRLVRLPENRYIFSLNAGLAVARGEFVAFCNNDMEVEDNFVEQALDCFVSDDIFAVCSRVLDRNGAEQGTRTAGYWKRGLLFYLPLPHSPVSTDCFFAVGGQSFYRRDVLTAMGSIDELLWPMYHEDIELSYRAWKNGYRIVYAPGSVCHHMGGRTSTRVFTTTQLRSFVRQNELLMVWKDVTDAAMLLEHVLWLVPRFAAALLRWDTGTLTGYGSAFRRLPRAVRSRRGAQAQFRRSDRAVLDLVGVSAIEAHHPTAG
ncbi:MAG: glycosyltransferase family 2 protein [Acidimicrobiales bacterium]